MLWSKGEWGLAQRSSYHLIVASGQGWPKVLECDWGMGRASPGLSPGARKAGEQEGSGKGLWGFCP